jgi:hypothetical protein
MVEDVGGKFEEGILSSSRKNVSNECSLFLLTLKQKIRKLKMGRVITDASLASFLQTAR